MKKSKIYKMGCLLGTMLILTTGCSMGKKENLVLDKTEMTIETGSDSTLHIINENSSQLYLTWSSSNEKIAKVENGKVEGLEAGKATINGCTKDGRKVECNVTVEDPEIKNVVINQTNLTLKVKKSSQLEATVNPDITDPQLSWTSSDSEVATVDSDGIVTAKKAGSAIITVQTSNGKQAKCNLTVKGTKKKTTTANTNTNTKIIYLTPAQIVDRYPNDFIFADSSERYLTDDDVDYLDMDQTQQAINEIYAREGHSFDKAYWRDFFGKYSWYVGYRKVADSDFSSVEYANIKKLTAHRNWLR